MVLVVLPFPPAGEGQGEGGPERRRTLHPSAHRYGDSTAKLAEGFAVRMGHLTYLRISPCSRVPRRGITAAYPRPRALSVS
jgi:hypothetical protein